MKQAFAQMLRTIVADFTKTIVRPDGGIRRIRWVGVPVTQVGLFQGFLGPNRCTDRERLTEECGLSEHYLSEGRGCHKEVGFTPLVFEHWSQERSRFTARSAKGTPTLEQYLAPSPSRPRFMANT